MMSARRTLLTVLSAAGALLLMASAAFACLTQKGSLVIDPSVGTTGSTVVGLGTAMDWCSWPATASTAAQNEQINVAVAPAECNGTTYSLGTGDYEVRLNHKQASWKYDTVAQVWKFQSGTGCWVAPSHKFPETLSVSNGSGNVNVTVPSGAADSNANEAAGLCVGNGSQGIFGPLQIT